MCGENARPPARPWRQKGSPPRVRGKLAGIMSPAGVVRITPACAGKTFQLAGMDVVTRDHPRVCGENSKEIAKILS